MPAATYGLDAEHAPATGHQPLRQREAEPWQGMAALDHPAVMQAFLAGADRGAALQAVSTLQGRVGNRAVQRLLTARPAATHRSVARTGGVRPPGAGDLAVQRCGPKDCGCSPAEHDDYDEALALTGDHETALALAHGEPAAQRDEEADHEPAMAVPVQQVPVQRGFWDDLAEAAGRAGSAVRGAASAVGSGIASGARAAGGAIASGARAVGSGVAAGARSAGSAIASGAGALWEGAQAAGGAIASGARAVGSGIASGARAVGSGIASGARAVGSGIASGLRSAGRFAVGVGRGIGRGARAAGNAVLGGVDWVRRRAAGAWGAVTGAWSNLKRQWTDDSPPVPDASGACPGGRVHHEGRCYDQRINGCGPADSVLENIVPNQGPAGLWNFEPACNIHDVCYGTPGKTQQQCDDDMMDNMRGLCAAHGPGAKQEACLVAAGVYHKAVAGGGETAFNRAQGVSDCPPLKRRLGLCSVPLLD